MSLNEEMPSNIRQQFSSAESAIKSKQSDRDEIARLTEEFLSSGRNLDKCKVGKESRSPFEYNNDAEVKEKRQKAHHAAMDKINTHTPIVHKKKLTAPIVKAKSGHQNIYLSKTKSGLRYQVNISNTQYGTFDDEKEALEVRDRHREILGLPKAHY